MILLIGGTSRLGKALAERLLLAGVPFRLACRNVAKAKSLSDRGVEVMPLNLQSGSSISASLTGVTKVISCIHGLIGASRASINEVDIRGQMALVDAAAEAGVGRFVFISALGASLDHPSEFWRAKAATEQHLKSSGLNYVILRPSAFMDLYAHDLIGTAVLRKNPVVVLGNGNLARNMIAVDDVASACFAALIRDDLTNEMIEIGGWESLTERDIAALYGSLSGNRFKVFAIPPFALRFLAAVISPLHAGVGRLLRLPLELEGRQDLHLDSASWTERLDINPIRLRDFAAKQTGEI
jgi:uncharacterized protein YbjT (DUF2867 family)